MRLSNSDLRLVTVNTPEMNFGNKRVPEPIAEDATRYVKDRISNKQLYLEEMGVDRYQRRLGNVWIKEAGRDHSFLLSERLIANGLGFQIFESDSRYAACLKQAELKARSNKLGVWQYSDYWLNVERGGFALWSGRLQKVSKSKQFYWWRLSDSRVVRVPKLWLDELGIETKKKGDLIELRGWVIHRKKTRYEPYMLPLRSPQILLKN
ncbi:thermonuclease family protein [Litoribrevibacter euphylliae]|uniref:Thermonuclease family protein n=1 Tax=Litoribrevibacter euphylliae TaxID=1834034 RepID=A0ABV7HEV8_9GAMM